MDEELKKLLGDAYQENMTADQIQEAVGKKFLATGGYVNKEMHDAEKRQLEAELNQARNDLQARMTDDEKKIEAEKAKEQRIKELEEKLRNNSIETNRFQAMSLTSETRTKSGIKDGDNEFSEFISNIISDNRDNTTKITSYLNKIVSQAYEKGKADILKEKMGKMGSFKANENNNSSNKSDEMQEFGKQLAQKTKKTIKENPYFKL